MLLRFLLVFIVIACTTIPSRSQLLIDTVPDPLIMLQDFFGDRVSSISNLETKGATDYWGLFNATQTNLGMDEGIILANGDCRLAIGSNDLLEVGIFDDTGLEGDTDMDDVSGYVTEDACILEFDFVPVEDTITFQFIWASEEYPEWVASQIYNDCFAIFLDGENIGLLPDGQVTSVNTVNCFGPNSEYYICNDPMNPDLVPCPSAFDCPATVEETTIQYDGWTKPLNATMVLSPGQTYHLKMGVADASDNGADSGAFVSISDNHTQIASLQDHDSGIRIFPNPTSGTVKYEQGTSEPCSWILTNSAGSTVWSGISQSLRGTFDWSHLAPGYYILSSSQESYKSPIHILILP